MAKSRVWRGRVAARRVVATLAKCERCSAPFPRPDGETWPLCLKCWRTSAARELSGPLDPPRPPKVLVEYTVGAPLVAWVFDERRTNKPRGGAK